MSFYNFNKISWHLMSWNERIWDFLSIAFISDKVIFGCFDVYCPYGGWYINNIIMFPYHFQSALLRPTFHAIYGKKITLIRRFKLLESSITRVSVHFWFCHLVVVVQSLGYNKGLSKIEGSSKRDYVVFSFI